MTKQADSTPSLIVLFEDERLLAVHKPSGQVTVPSRGESGRPILDDAAAYLNIKPFVVHRLDRGTSGILLFAKDAETHRLLNDAFASREVKKTYLALTQGLGLPDGPIDAPIRRFGSGRMGVDPEGKASTTVFRVLRRLKNSELVEALPETGRRHQIRVHLWHAGHPIIGDNRYGRDKPVAGGARLMLHAGRLAFKIRGLAEFDLTCEPPADFQEELDRFA